MAPAASQLQRLRDKQIPLTVAVDKVAASGGYMMACVANKNRLRAVCYPWLDWRSGADPQHQSLPEKQRHRY